MIRLLLIFIGLLNVNSIVAQQSKYYKIDWEDHLEGDFSFKNNWSYNENVFKNSIGQLVCDGFCDEELYQMRDENGIIYPDSISNYYEMFDTTHFYHTLECESNCSEFTGTYFVRLEKRSGDTLFCQTYGTVSTHCYLELTIVGDEVFPVAAINSILGSGKPEYYDLISGYLKIDKLNWDKGIFKAEFNYRFLDSKFPEEDIFWKGKIYALIY